jgi:hydroxypyruvate isomerase
MRLSANLGFLWTDLTHCRTPSGRRSVPGFDAVECHFPYDVPTGPR